MKLYGHNQANRRSAFIFALHCKKVWRLLIRGAPGVTYKGDGVTYKGDGLLIRRGPPCEWVSRTDSSHFHKKLNVAVKSMKLTCFRSLFVQKNEIVVFVE